MRKSFFVATVLVSLLSVSTLALAKADKWDHKDQRCEKCHSDKQSTPEVASGASFSLMATAAGTAVVNLHKTSGGIPASMKQQMIAWLTQRSLPLPADPNVAWSLSCNTCHVMHGSGPRIYPGLLRYNLLNGELCQMCHGGTINTAVNWTAPEARRVLYGPSNPGKLQPDGVTEIVPPAAPKYDQTVRGVVNFPLSAFTGIHSAKISADLAYKVTIPGSVFGERIISPASHMSWQFGTEMITWDTTLEANRPYIVVITPFTPSTAVEATPVVLSVIVDNTAPAP